MTGLDLSPFDAAAAVVVLTAVFATINARFLRLPPAIGLTILGALASAAIIVASRLLPGLHLHAFAKDFVDRLDFKTTLLDGMLSFLLFAGAFHIDWRDMRQGRWAILALASFGTLLSTALVGLGLKGLLLVVGHDMPLIWCLVFGALISPTDPVAVIAILKDAWLPPSIQATIATESLFNDGVGVVVFTIVFAAASGQQQMTLGEAARLFALEAGGGIVFGAVVGGIAFFLMRGIADLVAEVLITLAVVMGGYAAAQALGVSGPVAMAVAGLILGNQGVKYALSERSRDYVVSFWLLIDEILNAVLFLLVGLEAIAVWRENAVMLVALATVPIVLLARFISVGGPLLVLYRISSLGRGAVPILVWGGLRGGISIALALSIPEDSHKELILAATYAVVFFSVLVQGATIGRLAQRYRPDEDAAEAETT
ncbi:Na(+)/H(+) antiporter NhaP [Beijerinckiaceae bacterium RH CH11]|nr:sodium:proton antiporter [Beijerinckiaceae bacterium]VVB44684.1 Na(+)/H(+) antiporter NhaP [Beijerinckiaceae bacterium RH CH11]VVB44761.1 Na(+)/H(+) antiporter NhaP [Beijerinckiaceae bacterium RH AL8]